MSNSNGLKVARVSAGMTQKEAAEAIGVSRETISSWEGGNAMSMSIGNAVKACEAYGCSSIDALVGRA